MRAFLLMMFGCFLGKVFAVSVDRIHEYGILSKHLASMDDRALSALLEGGKSVKSSFAQAAIINVGGRSVFVKRIPLTARELSLRDKMPTANIFKLPLYYQYGVGSAGFGAWRELKCHEMTTQWFLDKETNNFPLMYHWRILPNTTKDDAFDEKTLSESKIYWGNSDAIEHRLRELHDAPASIAVFLECFPSNLKCWFATEYEKGPDAFDATIKMIERELLSTADFLKSKDMIHFDAHFDNILTDGECLYFSDFGLSITTDFDLSEEEMSFFRHHQNYDRSYVVAVFLQKIIYIVWGLNKIPKEKRNAVFLDILECYACGETPASIPDQLTPYQVSLLKKYAPISGVIHRFFQALMADKTKKLSYPAAELDAFWSRLA